MDLGERFREADQISTPDLWEEIERREPRATRPGPGRHRAVTVFVALVVAVAGVAFAVIAFRPGQSPVPAASTTSPFLSLWPQRSVELGPALLSDIGVVQRKADDGDPSATWQLSPTEVATRFANEVMGWPTVTVEPTGTNPEGSVVVTVHYGIIYGAQGCLQLGSGGQTPASGNCSGFPLAMGHEITLVQPGVKGTGGIWEVVEVHPVTSSEFDLGVSRGEALTAGQTLRFDFLDVPPGAVGLVASFDCARPLDVEGTVEVDPNHSIGTLTVPDLAPQGEGCIVPSPNGYLYAYSAFPPDSAVRAGDPFKSSVQIGEVAIVPVVLSRPEVSESPSPETAPSPTAPGGVSEVLQMTCAPDGTPQILTPVVRVQADGLHVVVRDWAGSEAVIFRQQARPEIAWSSGSNGLDDEFVTLVRPGETFVGCKGAGASVAPSPGSGVQSNEAAFTVVDPDHVWVPTDLVCGYKDQWSFHVGTSRATDNGMTPSEAARALVPGVQMTDVVEPGGYVAAKSEADVVRVVRDGEVVAWMMAHSQAAWSFDGYACPGSGIGEKP